MIHPSMNIHVETLECKHAKHHTYTIKGGFKLLIQGLVLVIHNNNTFQIKQMPAVIWYKLIITNIIMLFACVG